MLDVKALLRKILQWIVPLKTLFITADHSWTPDGSYGSAIRINGNSSPSNWNGDTYYLGLDQYGNLYVGIQLNGATSITWLRGGHVDQTTLSNTSVKNGSMHLQRQGSVVSMNCPNDFPRITGNTWVNYVTIPAGWRPSSNMQINAGNNVQARMMINSNGLVQFYYPSTVSSALNGAFSATWVATH